jgi:branched-chain amino acid transport system permease protein
MARRLSRKVTWGGGESTWAGLAVRVRQLSGGGVPLVALLLLILGFSISRPYYLIEGTTALTLAVAATGLGLALGLAGEFILGLLAIFAVSAYVTASLTVNSHWSFWLAGVLGILGATCSGLVLSLIGLKTSRFYFALVGFFIVYLIPEITQAFSAETGGSVGLPVNDVPTLFGSPLSYRGMFLLAAAVLVLGLALVRNVRKSPLGMQMRRMRDAPVMLAASGVQIWRVRVSTYLLCSALAGAGGAVYSHVSGYLMPTDFDLTTTTLLFAAVIVGGSTSLLGPSIGVVILYLVPLVINIESYTDLIYGTIVLISVILLRGGVEQAVRDLYARAVRGWQALRPTTLPPRSGTLSNSTTVGTAESVDLLVDLLWGLRDESTGAAGLVVRGARKHFGGVAALDMDDDTTISLRPGEVHVLLGPNGSGKTTMLNAISGLARLNAGTICLGEHELTRCSPAQIAHLGVSRSFQSPSLPPEVSPKDLWVAAITHMRRVSYVHWLTFDPVARRVLREAKVLASAMADAVGLRDSAGGVCSALTSGQRRTVDVVLTLTSRSRIVLLDEPAAGLSSLERQQLRDVVKGLQKRGIGFLIVEHDLNLAFSLADYVTVLSSGRVVAQGSPDIVRNDEVVRKVLTGAAK